MLKSTYAPSAAAPLPPGWTEHKAPTGHTYYYHAETKESTYKRPGEAEPSPYANLPSLADPNAANAYLAQFNPPPQPKTHTRPKPQPFDKPRRAEKIPGCEPWMLVYTRYSRRFAYNPAKKASYWRIPEKLMPAILEMDKAKLRKETEPEKDYDSSEYEEVEVTDDEDQPAKRRKTDEQDEQDDEQGEDDEFQEQDEVVEFTEADIAAQLQAMGDEYGLDPGDYDDGNMDEWADGVEGVEFSEDDAKLLFKDLLNDFRISPYSPWDKLLEEGKIIDDPRYTALSTTRARKECWDEWSREKIAELQAQRAQQEQKDPRIAYMAFLQAKATPKLYWPEFKRKYKKEAAMRDLKLADKDREKAYREHVSRLKLPAAKLKSDLTALLKAQPGHVLHNRSSAADMPTSVVVDVRYISLDEKTRDELVEAYLQTLPPPTADEGDKKHEARERREKALEERNRAVEEQRTKREREVEASKRRLRDEEDRLEMAMRVGKRGLQSQLR